MAPRRRTGPRSTTPATNPLSSGVPNFNFYTMEVVQRIGYDSFTPDEGVLIAKNKDRSSNTGGPNGVPVFEWTIDAHPEDINKIDFRRPNGEPVMRSIADYRQLNDALFHAGERSGGKAEWEDTPNRLHFYVIHPMFACITTIDCSEVRSYTVAVRSLDGSGPHLRGVALTALAVTPDGPRQDAAFEIRNTGTTAALPDSIHPRHRDSAFDSDVYRLTAAIEGKGWSADLDNRFAAVRAGTTWPISVQVRHDDGAAGSAKLTLRAVSESDPSKVATASLTVRR